MSSIRIAAFLCFCACLPQTPLDRDGLAETYGPDNRAEVFATSNADAVRWARSAVTFIPWDLIQRLSPEMSQVRTQLMSLRQRAGVCATERFSAQPSVGYCSGFLAGPDLVVTAGHCFRDNTKTDAVEDLCRTHAVVFGFAYETMGDDVSMIREEDLYRCAPSTPQSPNPVVRHDRRWKKDYAVLRLDRPVTGRDPLPMRRDGRVETSPLDPDGRPVPTLTLIGSPHGLPLKIDEGVAVTEADSGLRYFVTTADTYELNSGSVVLDDEGLVVGIHVGGGPDYVRDPTGCWTTRICTRPGSDGACLGSREFHAVELAQDVPVLPSELDAADSSAPSPAEPLPE